MSEVKRYSSMTGYIQDDEGDSVFFSDYDTLRAELEGTKAGHQRLIDALKDSHTVHVNILRGEIALSDAALLHIAKTRGIEGEQLKREADDLRAELEETKALLTSAQETISMVIDNKDKFVEQLIKTEAERDELVKVLEDIATRLEEEGTRTFLDREYARRLARTTLTRIKGASEPSEGVK